MRSSTSHHLPPVQTLCRRERSLDLNVFARTTSRDLGTAESSDSVLLNDRCIDLDLYLV